MRCTPRAYVPSGEECEDYRHLKYVKTSLTKKLVLKNQIHAIFWGCEGFLPEFPKLCLKSCCATFANKFSPTKSMKTFFGATSKSRSSFVFQQTLGAILARIFRDFTQMFKDFAKIFSDYSRILDKSKLLGVCLHLPNSSRIHHKQARSHGVVLLLLLLLLLFIVSYDSANKQKHHKSHRMQ